MNLEVQEEKQLTLAQKNDVALAAMQADLAEMGVSVKDLIIPRIMLMQNTSEMVGDEKAKLGDIVNSLSGNVIGTADKPLAIIPLKMFKTWRIMDMSGKLPEFLREEPMNAANEKLPREDKEGGKPIRRDESYNFYILLQDEIDKGEAFPCLVSFRRTSATAGRKLASHLFKRGMLQKKAYSQVVKLGVSKEKFESNTYAKFELMVQDTASNAAAISEAEKWLPIVGSMRVDQEREQEAAIEVARAPTVVGVESGSLAESDGPY